MGRGAGVVKGWPWGSGSHTNKVVALLHSKRVYEISPPKVGKMEYLVHSRSLFHQNQTSQPIFC